MRLAGVVCPLARTALRPLLARGGRVLRFKVLSAGGASAGSGGGRAGTRPEGASLSVRSVTGRPRGAGGRPVG